MEKISEIERKIKESQEKGKKLKQAYLNEIEEAIRPIKNKYMPNMEIEKRKQEELNKKLEAYWYKISLIDIFNVDEIGIILASLLSQTTPLEFTYEKINVLPFENAASSGSKAAIVLPVGKFSMENINSLRMTQRRLFKDDSIVVLNSFLSGIDETQVSFYTYNFSLASGYTISKNMPLYNTNYPQIQEFIYYVLEKHIEEYGNIRISNEELQARLQEFIEKLQNRKSSILCRELS